MTDTGIFRRRQLPHWDVPGQPVFITACLEGSISSAGLERIRKHRHDLETRPRPEQFSESEWEYHRAKLLFAFIDQLLDHQSPVRHLADSRQAEIVQNAFLHFAVERYRLLAFVVMQSHHHWLFIPNEIWATDVVQRSLETGQRRSPREIISHSIQSYTATMCNRVRGASGIYWQKETFDHWVRDEEEMFRIIDYIERNPVAAGLVTRPEDWTWSSARLRSLTGARRGDPLFHVK